jgi:hypothetical protein
LHRFLNDQPIKARPEGALRWFWRRARRHAASIVLGLSLVLTSAVLLIYLLSLNKPSPEENAHKLQQEALAALSRDLDLNKTVTLIGARGRPAYFRVRTDQKLANIVEATDGACMVQNWGHGLVELLPDPRLVRYRYSAEVQHAMLANHECRVGIYFAHSQQEDGETVAHFHCNVAFNDLFDVRRMGPAPGNDKGNSVGLQAHRQSWGGLINHKALVSKAATFFRPVSHYAADGALGPWRSIAVEVRPETIKVFWEGDCIATTPRAALMMCARPLIARPNRPLPANSPQFAPRGGLGLYVSLGVAMFRNVVVEPLGDEN